MTPIERPNFVRVINGLNEKIQGRYDGEDYEFLPGEPVDIPHVVAHHIFGFGNPNKVSALNRLGWLTSSDKLEEAKAKLSKLKFDPSPPLVDAPLALEMEPEDPPTADLLPAPSPGKPTEPPVSPEASGAGRAGLSRPALPKPRGA